MNKRHSLSLNGKVEAPAQISGASVVAAKPTTFPQESPDRSLRTFFYYSSCQHIGGTPVIRWIFILLLLAIPVWRLSGLPGGWWSPLALFGSAWIVLWITLYRWRKQDFVRFVPETLPAVTATALTPQEKLPVYATGFFSVEGKEQRFTWLPGFFRTFATREHAIMCQVAPEQRGMGRWPEDQVGLWYIFFSPEEIQTVQWGSLHFGASAQPAVAITYKRVIPKRGRFRPEKTITEVIYLAVEREADGHQILADLQFDQQQKIQT